MILHPKKHPNTAVASFLRSQTRIWQQFVYSVHCEQSFWPTYWEDTGYQTSECLRKSCSCCWTVKNRAPEEKKINAPRTLCLLFSHGGNWLKCQLWFQGIWRNTCFGTSGDKSLSLLGFFKASLLQVQSCVSLYLTMKATNIPGFMFN